MNLKPLLIRSKGDINKERLVIRVLKNTNIGEYILIRSGYNQGNIYTEVSDAFWFPDSEIKAGDLVVLYSKNGSDTKREEERRTVHFYYWEKEDPIWNDNDYAPVLMFAPKWEVFDLSKD